ncbi:hypothetical protein P4S72_15160 [Vibrio sp. PP-XX7]
MAPYDSVAIARHEPANLIGFYWRSALLSDPGAGTFHPIGCNHGPVRYGSRVHQAEGSFTLYYLTGRYLPGCPELFIMDTTAEYGPIHCRRLLPSF